MNTRWIQNSVSAVTLLLVVSCGGGGGGGTSNQSLEIKSFTSSLATINLDQSATLTWDVANATSVTIQPDIGAVDPKGSVPVSPNSQTTYTLTAKGGAETKVKEIAVSVNPFNTPLIKNSDGIDVSKVAVGVTNTLIISIQVLPSIDQKLPVISVTQGNVTLILKDTGDAAIDGDDTRGDNIFSGRIKFVEDQVKTLEFNFSVTTSTNSYNYLLKISVLAFDTDILANFNKISEQIDSKFNTFPENTSIDQILAQTKTYLDTNASTLKIRSTQINPDYILEVIDTSEIHSFFQVGSLPESAQPADKTTRVEQVNQITQLTPEIKNDIKFQGIDINPNKIGAGEALIFAPLLPQLGSKSASREVYEILQKSGIRGGLFAANYLTDIQADITSLREFYRYNFIFFETHGVNGDWLQTGTPVKSRPGSVYEAWLQNGQIAPWTYYYGSSRNPSSVKTKTWAVNADWLNKNQFVKNKIPNAVVINSICESLKTQNLSGFFRSRGAGTYFGYQVPVDVNFATPRAIEITKAMVQDLKTTGEAISIANVLTDPFMGAVIKAVGNKDLRF
jgi:hypothetical protein